MIDAGTYQQMWDMAMQLAREEAEKYNKLFGEDKENFIKERAKFHIKNMLMGELKQD